MTCLALMDQLLMEPGDVEDQSVEGGLVALDLQALRRAGQVAQLLDRHQAASCVGDRAVIEDLPRLAGRHGAAVQQQP
ncbi:hypothetical protein WL26_22895 [Burkholderia cepacia]|nr:hypothetical protein WL26_22895 [Burkholderia cepacia]